MPEEDEPIQVGSEKQLFLDEMFLAAESGVRLAVHSPADAGTAIRADRPWENDPIAGTWCSVLRDPRDGDVRLYYLGSADLGLKPNGKKKFVNSLCCAISQDGVSWEKPSFGVCEFMGDTGNNIVFLNYTEEGREVNLREMGTVAFDPNDVPERRYKMMFFPKGCQMRAAYSPDGIRWTIANEGRPVVRQFSDSQNVFFRDDSVGRWVGYFRAHAGGRCVARLETDDFESWPDITPDAIVLAADELDSYVNTLYGPYLRSGESIGKFGGGRRYDPEAPPDERAPVTDEPTLADGVDIYNHPVIKYPWAANAYVMPFSAFYHKPNKLEVHLAVSRDGIHWSRPGDRQPWIRLPLDEEGVHVNYVGHGVVRDGDRLYHYHSHPRRWHAGARPGQYETDEGEPYSSSIRRDALRLDGYTSVDAGNRESGFITPPLVHSGRRLELNVDTGAGGWLRVELLDPRGRATGDCRMEGYALDDCERIVTNSTHHTVTWKGGSDVAFLAGRAFRMRFAMRNARLYAFQFVD